MPEIVIIGGPNGAGKTSFANQFLKDFGQLAFVNADEIARDLSGRSKNTELKAARQMLKLIDRLVSVRANLMLETTLASLTYAQRVPKWRDLGYTVTLIYLRLPSADHAISRVEKRVMAGGHNIPIGVIRTRYDKSVLYLETLYKPVVDHWQIWDSLDGGFTLVEQSG